MGSSPASVTSAGPELGTVATRELKTTLMQNKKCIAYCVLLSVSTMQYGLDLSIINAAQAMRGFLVVFGYESPGTATGYGITTSFQQLITSMMNLGVIIGSLFIDPAANLLGRRRSFLIGSAWAFLGVTILVASTNKSSIVFGRFCVGFSNALFTGIYTIYVSEAAPAHLRGPLVSLAQLSVCIGTVIGAVINNATKHMDSRLSYQIPLFLIYVVPAIMLVLAFVMPESPRWLITRDENERALHHLRRLRGSNFPDDLLLAELELIKEAALAEKEETASASWGAVKAIFSDAERTRTLLTFAALTFHAASGFPFLAGYSTYFFEIAGSTDAFVDTIIVTCVSVLGATGGVISTRFFGRRPMLFAAYSVQAILMLVVGVTWTVIPGTKTAGKIIVGMCVIFQCLFSMGCGPIAFVVGGELPSNRLRAVTYGIGSAIGFIFNFIISLTTPYFINPEALNVGPKIGYIWFASNFITLIFVFFFIPETHKRTLENIDEMFYAKVPLRKFKGYHCTDVIIVEHGTDNKPSVQHTEDAS